MNVSNFLPCSECEYPWGNKCGKPCAYDPNDKGQNTTKNMKENYEKVVLFFDRERRPMCEIESKLVPVIAEPNEIYSSRDANKWIEVDLKGGNAYFRKFLDN